MNNSIEKIIEGLNEQQAKAVANPIKSCTKIVAGAGTGKTKIISKRFLKLVSELLEQGELNPQSKILVITFTDKAANEMKERIVSELEANGLDSTASEDMWVSTFHSFCIRILKKYSIEVGLSPSFKMAEEKDLKKIYDNLIKRIKYNEVHTIENIEQMLQTLDLGADILSVDTLKKLTAISDLETIFEDIYSTIKKIKSLGITPKEFLVQSIAVTGVFSEIIKNTPFKFASKEDYAFAWSKHFKAYSDDSCELDDKLFDLIAKEKIILDKFGKRNALDYGMAEGFPENIEPITELELLLTKVIASIFLLYQNELEKNDIADFDDLINKTITIFKQNNQIREHYQNHFKQIIVDEFQDTNGAQLELIELLLNPDFPNLTFVGDRKQSIYGFRYAQMENLEVLHKNVENRYLQKFEPINLSINYRSLPEVLNAVNYVTEQELKLENENLCANPNLEYADSSKDIKVTIIDEFENSYEQHIKEATYIAQEIEMLLERDKASYKDFAILVKSHAQADMLEKELKKRNIPSIKKVNTGFFVNPVVKNMISAFRLIKNSDDEQAFLRLLKVLLSDSEIYELKKFMDKKLYEELSLEEVKKLNFAQKFSYIKNKEISLENFAGEYARKIFDVISELRKNKRQLSLLQIFEKVIKTISLYKTSNMPDIIQAKNNLKILSKIIDDFEQSENYVSVNSLLDYIDKISEDKNFELPTINTGDVDAVQILTIHASKGLEFPYVFVLSISSASKTPEKSGILFDMQYGEKPGFGIMLNKYKGKQNPKALIYKRLWQDIREKNEAIRLFYVAVSRAKKYLNVLSFEPYASVKPAEYIENLREFLN